MLCPYCLQDTSGTACQHCKETLPPLYVQRRGVFSKGPAILSAVGFSGHGKTVYLASLLYMLEKRLTQVWPKFYRQALDIDGVRTVQDNLKLLQEGNLPESTRRNFPRPNAHLLADIPHYGTRDMLIYDPPGEAFNSDEGIERYAFFVQRARVILFLVSLVDLEEPKAEDLFRLLNTYVLGMARMKAKTRNQHLVVAYTKADRLIATFGKHPAVLDHLRNADHSAMVNPKKYLDTLKMISADLAVFTEQELEARAFMNLTHDQFKSVVFCAVSALGSPPEGEHLATAIEPRRVADPLIWVLDKS